MFLLVLLAATASQGLQIRKGISGQLVGLIVDEGVIAGTTTGIFILDTSGNPVSQFPTKAPVMDLELVGDISGDGISDICIATADQEFANVAVFDRATAQTIWTYKPMIDAYDEELMWVRKETITWDIEVVGDIDGDGRREIAAASGWGVHLLDGGTGEPLWVFNATNDIWQVKATGDLNGDGFGELAAGSQDGFLYLIDVANRAVIWEKHLANDFTVLNPAKNTKIGDVTRSVWDIVSVNDVSGDGISDIAVSAEDGYVYLINAATGDIIWDAEAIEYENLLLYSYYGADRPYPTGITGDNFFNIRLKQLNEGLLVSTYAGAAAKNEGKEHRYISKKEKLTLLDINDGSVLWDRPMDFKTIRTPEVHNGMILVPNAKIGRTQLMTGVNTTDGSIRALDYNTTVTREMRGNRYMTRQLDKDRYIIASDSGDLACVNLTVEWAFPRYGSFKVISEDVTGDQTKDLVVMSAEKVQDDKEGTTRMIYVIDGSEQRLVWEYVMPYRDYELTGGLRGVQIVDDMTGDGKSDIISYSQRHGTYDTGDTQGNYSRVWLFDGATGELAWNVSVSKREFYGVYDRLYRDPPYLKGLMGINESAAEAMSRELEQISSLRHALLQFPRVDYEQIENLQRRREEIGRNMEEFGQRLQDYERQKTEMLERKEQYRVNKRIVSIDFVNDQNHDSVPDLIVSAWQDVYAMSGKDGSVIWNRVRDAWPYDNPFDAEDKPVYLEWPWLEHEQNIILAVDDVSDDGKRDLILVKHNEIQMLKSDYGFQKAGWVWKPNGEGFDREALRLIEDITGDGRKDILVTVHRQGLDSVYRAIDSRSGEVVFETPRQDSTTEWGAGDLNADGHADTLNYRKWSNDGPILEVISGADSKSIFTYRGIQDSYVIEQLNRMDAMPATVVEDVSGDGVKDLLIAQTKQWEKGVRLVIHDVNNGEELEKIDLDYSRSMFSGSDERYSPAIRVTTIPDMTGDGRKEVAIIGALSEGWGKSSVKLIVFDLAERNIVREYDIDADRIFVSGGLFVTSTNGDVYELEEWETQIMNNDPVYDGIFDLEWTSRKDALHTVYVDDQKIAILPENRLSLNLREGQHKISLKTTDASGSSVYDYLRVKVSRQAIPLRVINSTILVIGLIFAGIGIWKKCR
ncbi:MAG: PQQ-binding-like beta-propeller repeat protein [archaeon]